MRKKTSTSVSLCNYNLKHPFFFYTHLASVEKRNVSVSISAIPYLVMIKWSSLLHNEIVRFEWS